MSNGVHTVQAFVEGFHPTPRLWDALLSSFPAAAAASTGAPTGELSSKASKWMIDAIGQQESQAERSLMHRFDTAHKVRVL